MGFLTSDGDLVGTEEGWGFSSPMGICWGVGTESTRVRSKTRMGIWNRIDEGRVEVAGIGGVLGGGGEGEVSDFYTVQTDSKARARGGPFQMGRAGGPELCHCWPGTVASTCRQQQPDGRGDGGWIRAN